MHDCSHHDHTISFPVIADDIGLIISLFIMGLSGSFTHCIGMCGPIALAQISLKLMHLDSKSLNARQKLKTAILAPYYIGKGITYSMLALVVYLITTAVSEIPYLRYIGAALLFATAVFFLAAAFNKKIQALKVIESKIGFHLNDAMKSSKLSPYGMHGLILGMILGLIPCGLVYGAITLSVAGASSAISSMLGMLAFAAGTIPGLFIAGYAGTAIFTQLKSLFKVFFAITMSVNAILLCKFALNLLNA